MTEEEYLNNYEERLIEKLTSNFGSLNKNLIYCFTLMFIFLLLKFNILEEASVSGNKIKMTEEQLLFFMPLIIMVPYFLINNSIKNIARIVSLLKSNSKKIIEINAKARPFKIIDLDFLSQGIASIQLEFSRWIVKKYLTKNDFNLTVKIPEKEDAWTKVKYTFTLPFKLWNELNRFSIKIVLTAIWILFLVLIYILPLLVSIWIIYISKLSAYIENFKSFSDIFNVNILITAFLVIMIVYTLISNLILYSLYFNQLSELKDNLNEVAIKRINSGFEMIFKYYKGKAHNNV